MPSPLSAAILKTSWVTGVDLKKFSVISSGLDFSPVIFRRTPYTTISRSNYNQYYDQNLQPNILERITDNSAQNKLGPHKTRHKTTRPKFLSILAHIFLKYRDFQAHVWFNQYVCTLAYMFVYINQSICTCACMPRHARACIFLIWTKTLPKPCKAVKQIHSQSWLWIPGHLGPWQTRPLSNSAPNRNIVPFFQEAVLFHCMCLISFFQYFILILRA